MNTLVKRLFVAGARRTLPELIKHLAPRGEV